MVDAADFVAIADEVGGGGRSGGGRDWRRDGAAAAGGVGDEGGAVLEDVSGIRERCAENQATAGRDDVATGDPVNWGTGATGKRDGAVGVDRAGQRGGGAGIRDDRCHRTSGSDHRAVGGPAEDEGDAVLDLENATGVGAGIAGDGAAGGGGGDGHGDSGDGAGAAGVGRGEGEGEGARSGEGAGDEAGAGADGDGGVAAGVGVGGRGGVGGDGVNERGADGGRGSEGASNNRSGRRAATTAAGDTVDGERAAFVGGAAEHFKVGATCAALGSRGGVADRVEFEFDRAVVHDVTVEPDVDEIGAGGGRVGAGAGRGVAVGNGDGVLAGGGSAELDSKEAGGLEGGVATDDGAGDGFSGERGGCEVGGSLGVDGRGNRAERGEREGQQRERAPETSEEGGRLHGSRTSGLKRGDDN